MYPVRVNLPINFTFSDDSLFLLKHLGRGNKLSEFLCSTVIYHLLNDGDISLIFFPGLPLRSTKEGKPGYVPGRAETDASSLQSIPAFSKQFMYLVASRKDFVSQDVSVLGNGMF